MNRFYQAALAAATVALLAIPFAAWSSEQDGVTDKEVASASGSPPVVLHSLMKDGELRDCLSCHEDGKYNAPPTPHPERKYCAQCHGQGEIKVDLDKK